MEKILVSACLLGEPVRYDGQSNVLSNERSNLRAKVLLDKWKNQGRTVSVCPEMAGGLPTPRPAAEIQHVNAASLDSDKIKIITIDGLDVSEAFHSGAQKALVLAQKHNCKYALMAARSPSCGNEQIYDGSFENNLVNGKGVTAALLEQHGIRVFNQNQIEALFDVLYAANDQWVK